MTQLGPRDPFIRRASGHYGRLSLWEGHEIVELTSSHLHLKVSLSRGAEVLELRSKKLDLDLLWHGHEDIVRHRPSEQSIGAPMGNFLDHFGGGWQEVLPAAQFPVEYKGAPLGGHGEVAMLSWGFRVLVDDVDSLSVEFSVDLRRLPMRLIRVMTLKGPTLKVDESLENLSEENLDYQWGQHLVFGGPFIDEGTEIIAKSGEKVEIPDYSGPTYRYNAGSTSRWPTAYSHDGDLINVSTLGRTDGTDGHLILGPMEDSSIIVRNHNLKTAMNITWNRNIYPYCWIWMVLGGIRQWPLWGQERLLGIEPFSSPVVTLTDAIAQGSALKLAPREKVTTWVGLEIQTIRDQQELGS